MSYYPTPSAPEPNSGTKATIGMTTWPSIIAQDLSAVPAVRGTSDDRPVEPRRCRAQVLRLLYQRPAGGFRRGRRARLSRLWPHAARARSRRSARRLRERGQAAARAAGTGQLMPAARTGPIMYQPIEEHAK